MLMKEISITESVSADVVGNIIKVSGPKGQIERQFDLARDMKIEKADGRVKVSSDVDSRESRALVGTIIAHIRNMFLGVTKGYTYRLRTVSAHFPITVKVEGSKIMIQNFLGERKPRVANILNGVQVKLEGQDVVVTGMDVEKVSQTSANIEQATRIVGYDKKIFQDGIYLVSREG